MNIIILGGNSKKNINWVREMKELFIDDNVFTISYDNWYNDKEMDVDIELNKLINVCKNLDSYIIICKSIGSIITFNGILKDFISPKMVIVFGLPIYMCYSNNIDINNMIINCSLKTNILIIEQINDPIGCSSDIKKILPKKIMFYEIDGDDHHYDNYIENKKIIDKFIGGNND